MFPIKSPCRNSTPISPIFPPVPQHSNEVKTSPQKQPSPKFDRPNLVVKTQPAHPTSPISHPIPQYSSKVKTSPQIQPSPRFLLIGRILLSKLCSRPLAPEKIPCPISELVAPIQHSSRTQTSCGKQPKMQLKYSFHPIFKGSHTIYQPVPKIQH